MAEKQQPRPHDRVRIKVGALAGLVGVVEEVDIERSRAVVYVSGVIDGAAVEDRREVAFTSVEVVNRRRAVVVYVSGVIDGAAVEDRREVAFTSVEVVNGEA